MVSRLNPYLSFSGDARQAMEFYRDVFGGTLTVTTYGEYGEPNAPGADRIMHSQLATPSGFTLMGADSPADLEHTVGNTFSVSLSGDDEAELRGYWEKLSVGGTVSLPLEQQMWGDVFGMCTDRFGVPWLVDIAQQRG
ncbi:VOC family protein [Streptomyces sp. NPDC004752]